MKNFISGSQIEFYLENKNACSIHTRHKLMQHGGYCRTDDLIEGEKIKKDLPLTKTTIMGLLTIPGIKNVSVHPYEIVISKAAAFSWEELFPQIALMMSRYLPATYN